MNSAMNIITSEAEAWAKKTFNKYHDITLKITGTCGNGLSSLTTLATLNATNEKGTKEVLNLIFKRRKILSTTHTNPKAAFANEIFCYEEVFANCRQFEEEQGVTEPFDNIPKYYGSYVQSNSAEVLVMEDISKKGYQLINDKLSMSIGHIQAVLEAYGKFHAISLAMREKEPQKFKALEDGCTNMLKMSYESHDATCLLKANVDEICDLLKNDVPENDLNEWRVLKEKANELMMEAFQELPGVKVFSHCAPWRERYMFQTQNDNEIPQVSIIDWQMIRTTNPTLDISGFIYCAIDPANLSDWQQFLSMYHKKLTDHLVQLGCDPKLYTWENLLQDWKKYAIFSLLFANLIVKLRLIFAENNLVREECEKMELVGAFKYPYNEHLYKKQMAAIIRHAVKTGLLGR